MPFRDCWIGTRLRFAGAALAAGITFGGVAGGAVLPSEKDAWIEVRTPHFTLYSDASESKTKEIGLDLERFRSVLLLLRKSLNANSPVPTFVFVWKSESAMRPYLPIMAGRPRQSDGYFQATSDGNYIALCAAWNTDPRPVVYHEYLHYFLHNNFPPQPLWYDEGLAEFYRTFRADNKGAEIGRPIEGHLFFLRQNAPMPLERLFRVGHDSREYNEESQAGIFYAESWALVHYLLRGEPNRTAELGRFLVLLQHGTNEEAAFREAFGTDFQTLFSQLVAYVHGSRFSYRRLSFEDLKISPSAEVRKLDYPETLFRLGDLLAHESEGQFDAAEAHLQAALAGNPSHSGALATLGWIRMRQQQEGEAALLLEKSMATGSADYRAYFYYGDLLMRLLGNEVIPLGRPTSRQRPIIDDARRALQRSVELNSDFAEARARLGRTYLVEDDSCLWEGIAELEIAVQKLPSRKDVALDLARLYERKGELAKSEQLIQSAFGGDSTEFALRAKTEGNWKEPLERVNRLLAENKDDEAIALFEKFLSGAPEDVRAAYQDQLAALRKAADERRPLRQYNEALRLLKERDYQGALALFEKVAASAGDADLARAASEKADQIRRILRSGQGKRPRANAE